MPWLTTAVVLSSDLWKAITHFLCLIHCISVLFLLDHRGGNRIIHLRWGYQSSLLYTSLLYCTYLLPIRDWRVPSVSRCQCNSTDDMLGQSCFQFTGFWCRWLFLSVQDRQLRLRSPVYTRKIFFPGLPPFLVSIEAKLSVNKCDEIIAVSEWSCQATIIWIQHFDNLLVWHIVLRIFGKVQNRNHNMFSVKRVAQVLLAIFRSIFFALLPSYVQRRLQRELATPQRESPTTYLNGFRGVMAFLVFVRHFSLPWQSDLDYGFGQGENHIGWFRLPILRMLYAGPNVPVFLVVSGFVMSLKPLRLLKLNQKEAFLKSMVSSVFRRAIRMFPSPIISSFIYMLAVHFGIFKVQYDTMDKFIPHHPHRLPSFYEQFKDWLEFVFGDLTTPWSWKVPLAAYGPHLWTIGLQFRSSMVLFLVLIGLVYCRKKARQIILTLLFAYCMFSQRWDVALYIGGMLMAGTVGDESQPTLAVDPHFDLEKGGSLKPAIKFRSRIYSCCVLLAGLYLASYPRARDGVGAPGYRFIYSINSYYQYWQGCGALLLIHSLMCCKTAQKPFNTSFPQYLGEIAFSIYIVHEPLLHILGYGIVNTVWSWTGKDTVLQYQVGFFLGLLLTTPILLVSQGISQNFSLQCSISEC